MRTFIRQQEILENTVKERTQTISQQAEELRTLDKAKSKFLANISHEFRTPLTLILNTIEEENATKINENLTRANDNNLFTIGKFIEANELNIIHRNSHRLQKLIDQLLDLAQLENNKMELSASPYDFYKYLKNLIDSFEYLAQKKNIVLQFIATHENTTLYFDREKMDKIIYNIIGNALKFTPEGETITINLQKKENHLSISVKDTGIGIPPQDLDQIFNRFYQVKRKDKYRFEGTGLGLALVKELVELHHGNITVQSTIHQGTEFTVNFLLGKTHFSPEEIGQSMPIDRRQKIGVSTLLEKELTSENQNTDEEKPLLLIIEDNADLRYHQQKRFENTYHVLLAKDGEEGLELALEHIPDLILCDVMMPNKNGYEVCQILKKDERTNHIPILMLTAKTTHSAKMEGLLLGANQYMTKPYDQKELSLRLHNLWQQTQSVRNQFQSTSKEELTLPQDPFVLKIYEIIEENYTNFNFNVEELSNAVRLSRSQLFRKLKALTGQTPTHLIRTYRLEKAKNLLEKMEGNASEIAYMVGFSNPTYFHKCFKKEYGVTPKEFSNTPKSS